MPSLMSERVSLAANLVVVEVDTSDPRQRTPVRGCIDGESVKVTAVVFKASVIGFEIAGYAVVDDTLPCGVDLPVDTGACHEIMLYVGEQSLIRSEQEFG